MSRVVCNCMVRPEFAALLTSSPQVDRLLRRRCQSPKAQDVWRSIASNALRNNAFHRSSIATYDTRMTFDLD